MKGVLILSLLASTILCTLCPLSASAYGAIAVADNGGKGEPAFALVVGHKTESSASQEALKQCKAGGGVGCKVVLIFERCGSIATSSNSYGVGSAPTGRHARNKSLRQCGDNCRVADNRCEDY